MTDESKNGDQTSDLFKEIDDHHKAEIKLNRNNHGKDKINDSQDTVVQPLRDWTDIDAEYNKVRNTDVEPKKKKSMTREIMEYVIIFAITLVAVNFIHKNIFTPVSVDGDSMNPTLKDKDYVFLWELGEINRFDIIVFQATPDDYYVKRVIGLPGDEIRYDNDVLYINNEAVPEPFLEEGKNKLGYDNKQFTRDFTMKEICSITYSKTGELCYGRKIPEGYFLVMGDNRPISHDSEEIGLISEDTVLGKTKFILYPFDRFGSVK